MILRLLGLALLTACATPLLAQQTPTDPPPQYQPQAPRTINFNSGEQTPFKTQPGQRSSNNGIPERFAFKVPLTGFPVGEYVLIGEYAFHPKFSLEAALGVTHKNYMYTLLSNADTQDPGLNSDGGTTEAKLGFAGHLHLRYYPSDLMDGFYIGPWIRYRNYNVARTYGPIEMQSYVSSDPDLTDYASGTEDDAIALLKSNGVSYKTQMDGGRNLTDYMVGFGWMARFEDYAFFDLTFGLGIRSETLVKAEQPIDEFTIGSGNTQEQRFVGYFNGNTINTTTFLPTAAAQLRIGVIIK